MATAPPIPLCPTPDAHPATCPCPRRTAETYYGQPIATTRDISEYQEQHVTDGPQFFIRRTGTDWTQVTLAEFVAGEQQAGLRSDQAHPDKQATWGFVGGNIEGRVEYSGLPDGSLPGCPDAASQSRTTPDDDPEQAAEARRYGEQVNVPLSERTIAALRDRLASGDVPTLVVHRTTSDNPAASGDTADNPGATFTETADGWRWDRPERPGQTEAAGVGYLTEAEARADFALYDAEDRQAAAEDEMTLEEASDLANRLGLDLYRAQDALAFVEECCVIADREGQPVTTARVRQWLQGVQCGRQMLLGPTLPERAQAAIRTLQQQVEVRDRQLATTGAVAVPTEAFAGLVKVAKHVSAGRSFAFDGQGPYPDAAARRALGALHDAGLLDTTEPTP